MDFEALSFEDAFALLEETVRTLEGGDLTLAQMVGVYEQGVRLSERCVTLLDAAELAVTQLIQTPEGELATTPFDLRGSVPAPSDG